MGHTSRASSSNGTGSGVATAGPPVGSCRPRQGTETRNVPSRHPVRPVTLDPATRARVEEFLGGPYVETGLLATEEVIGKRPDVCRKVVLAIVRANRWIASHTPAQITERLPDPMVGDRKLYVTALEQVRDGYSKDGRLTIEAVETVVRAHRAVGLIKPEQRVDPARLIDNTSVEQALADMR